MIRTSNIPHRNVQNKSPFNTLITLQKETDSGSSVIINNDKTYQNKRFHLIKIQHK